LRQSRINRGLLMLLAFGGPGIAAGVVSGYSERITIQDIETYPDRYPDAWSLVGDDWKDLIRDAIRNNPRFLESLSVDWLVEAIREESPQIASYILNSHRIQEYLEGQISMIKVALTSA